MLYRKVLLLLLIIIPFLSTAQTAERFDVIITEIMADPTPVVGLPNAEFVEIKNVSSTPLNLIGWKLSDATATGTINSNFILQPDSIVILCSTGNVTTFSSFGRTIGVASFPSLDNDGDLISLKSPQGKTIHAVNYTVDWYKNEVKKDGGWSLEMIDINNPCSGISNWKASADASGGTPGKKNSVDGLNADVAPPQLLRTYNIDNLTMVALFDEPLDSASASSVSNYSLNNTISIASATPQGPLFNSVILRLSTPLQKQTIYTLTATNIKDCKGNSIGVYNKAKAGLAEDALSFDVIINEILFNPRPNAYDYVEIYNRSNKIVDANKLYIANRNAAGVLGSIKKLTETPFYIYPEEYIVITENTSSLQHEYLVQNPQDILVLSSLPSFPDDKGVVVITNFQGNVVDEVSYSEKWHFGLIGNDQGVALERINPNDSSQKQSNWHSAASTVNYGTPTYRNSQYQQSDLVNATIEIHPKVFSPDNDGYNDIATIDYKVTEPGYVANITVLDGNGRLVRYLVKNALLGLKGSWNWDGLNENGQKLPVGTYIVYTEIFNLQGKKKQFKNTIVLARRLN